MSDNKGGEGRDKSFLDRLLVSIPISIIGRAADILSVAEFSRSLAEYLINEERRSSWRLDGLSEQRSNDLRARAITASAHLAEAGNIFAELQVELGKHQGELTILIDEIDHRKDEVAKWQSEEENYKERVAKLTADIERIIGTQLRRELDRNLRWRQFKAGLLGIVAIIIGGFVGVWVSLWPPAIRFYNEFISPLLPR